MSCCTISKEKTGYLSKLEKHFDNVRLRDDDSHFMLVLSDNAPARKNIEESIWLQALVEKKADDKYWYVDHVCKEIYKVVYLLKDKAKPAENSLFGDDEVPAKPDISKYSDMKKYEADTAAYTKAFLLANYNFFEVVSLDGHTLGTKSKTDFSRFLPKGKEQWYETIVDAIADDEYLVRRLSHQELSDFKIADRLRLDLRFGLARRDDPQCVLVDDMPSVHFYKTRESFHYKVSYGVAESQNGEKIRLNLTDRSLIEKIRKKFSVKKTEPLTVDEVVYDAFSMEFRPFAGMSFSSPKELEKAYWKKNDRTSYGGSGGPVDDGYFEDWEENGKDRCLIIERFQAAQLLDNGEEVMFPDSLERIEVARFDNKEIFAKAYELLFADRDYNPAFAQGKLFI